MGPDRGIVVGVLGQWASGKTEGARTLIRHLGGEGQVVFLTDRVLFASQVVKYILELEEPQVVVSVEADGRQRLDGELASVWLDPGEDLKTVDPGTLNFDIYDDQILYAWRKRAKAELGLQIRAKSAAGKPIVIEAAFGPSVESEGESLYGRTILNLFARLEKAGVDPSQVKWLIIEAGYDKRAERNRVRRDSILVDFFEEYGADGGDLTSVQQRRLEEQGTKIKRVPNEHDDIEKFRADVITAFEEMSGR